VADVSPESEYSVCFHCGQPVPSGTCLTVQVDGTPRPMCCRGCQAVCEAIVSGGLGAYYSHRAALPGQPAELPEKELSELGLFDHPDFQKTFVHPLEGTQREADLILEGITCAACVWLNERHLARLDGVLGVQVNYATRRAKIRWDDSVVRLSDILSAVVSIGYRAHPYDAGRAETLARREQRDALWRLLVAGLGMMQIMMYAIPVYMAGAADMSPEVRSLMRWAGMLLTLPVIGYSAAPFFRRAWRDLRLLRVGMDVPVSFGVGIAFLASVWATLVGRGEVYFDSVSMFVFFLLGGRYLEMLARQRVTRGADSLGRLLPLFACRILEEGGVEEKVPVASLVQGDRVLVRPGETIVVDGQICAGDSEVSEAWLTGESVLLPKHPGDDVLGGSLNGSGVLEIRATRVGDATRLATVRRLMERAMAERPHLVELADQAAAWFTACLLVLAIASGVFWTYWDASRALEVIVSVLVVSCPCALSLATPAVLTVATDAAARMGILVTRGSAIETLARVRHFVFDKTGTLTTGRMHIARIVVPSGGDPARSGCIAAALERYSEHAIARAFRERDLAAGLDAMDVRIVPGQGVTGSLGGECYWLGRLDFVRSALALELHEDLAFASGYTVIYLGKRDEWLAAFEIADELRPDARDLVDALRTRGCRVSMLSGDSQASVLQVAQVLEIERALAELLPEDKLSAVCSMQDQGDVVAMVGDGINDAPVLAQAHVSIAVTGATELARHQADILLLGDSLLALSHGHKLARHAHRIICENLFWAIGYNLVAIPAAMAGWVTPLVAGVGMGLSSLLVVANALRLAHTKGA